MPPMPGKASNVWDRTLPEVKEADEDLKEEEDDIIADELCICEELIDWDLKEEDIEVAFEPEVMEKPFISFFVLFTAVMLLATAMLDCLNDFDSTFVPLLTAHSPASGGVWALIVSDSISATFSVQPRLELGLLLWGDSAQVTRRPLRSLELLGAGLQDLGSEWAS